MENEIKIWAQIFFDDGSVTQGKRIPAKWLDEEYKPMIYQTAVDLLDDVNRTEGWMLLWGAGNMIFERYSIVSSQAAESNSLES